MELPKHTTQVGTIPANKKMYLEDYCISYMKQLDEQYPGERKQVALFGTLDREKNTEYAFAYGAALLGRGKGRTDSLTNSQKEEAENYRQKYFSEYQLVGVVIATDSVNENVYWLGNGTKSIVMDGYYMFYDQNEVMLSFMMQNQEERELDLDPIIVKKADMDREKRERKEKEEKEKEETNLKGGTYRRWVQSTERTGQRAKTGKSPFPAAACFLVVAITCIYGMKTYYPDMGAGQIKSAISNLWGNGGVLTGNYLEDVSSEELVADGETTASTEGDVDAVSSELVIVSGEVEQPAELDVIVVPDLEAIVDGTAVSTPEPEMPTSEPAVSAPEPVVPTAVPAATESQSESYLIKRGDNLLRILRAHYGDESKLQEICDVNGIADPNNIQVGQTILLP